MFFFSDNVFTWQKLEWSCEHYAVFENADSLPWVTTAAGGRDGMVGVDTRNAAL